MEKINGVDLKVEFDADFTDADFLDKIDKGIEVYLKKTEELREKVNELDPAEGIRQGCQVIRDFLDYVFGDGASKKLLNKKSSLNECIDTFEGIIKVRDSQYTEMADRLNKYSPERLKR